jgi:hypothetical protein
MYLHQAVATERAEATLVQIGGQDVQFRPFGKLEEAGVAKEILLIVVFQHARARQFSIGQPQKPERPLDGEAQGIATENPIADIEFDEREKLGGRLNNSLDDPLLRAQLSTRCAAMMLPPETEQMWVTRDTMPASRR